MKKSINPCLVLGALLVAACFAVKVSAGEPTIWTKIQSILKQLCSRDMQTNWV